MWFTSELSHSNYDWCKVLITIFELVPKIRHFFMLCNDSTLNLLIIIILTKIICWHSAPIRFKF